MAVSHAKTVTEYLRALEPERRAVISKVRKVVKDNMPKGYAEGMVYGAITWHVPLSTFPDTYNGQPLCYAALAAQKHYNALYLMTVYGDAKQRAFLRDEFKKRGLKFDMGKACLRFRSADDLPLEAIGKILRSTPPKAYIAVYDMSRKKKSRGSST
jgi:uncharacterized protein DUF1801